MRPRSTLHAAIAAFGTACARPPAPPAQPVPPTQLANPPLIVATYREPASVFEILENASSWYPGKVDREYRDDWQSRFGVTPEDERQFAAYKEVRKRYYELPAELSPEDEKAGAGLLGRRKPTDRVAAAFYAAPTLPAALDQLASFMQPADVVTLRGFYEHFRPELQPLLAESAAFQGIARQMQAALDAPATARYVLGLAAYYDEPELPAFEVLYVWWPPAAHSTAHTRDRFLLMEYNPVHDAQAAAHDVDIPVHEIGHYLSARLPEPRKRSLGRAFIDACAPTWPVAPVRLVEEPLAVVHQKLYLGIVAPERLSFTRPWYGGEPWVDPFAKRIFPVVQRSHEAGGKLDEALMAAMGKLCADVPPPASGAPGQGGH